MITITCFALDDEPHALKLLNHYIEQTPFLKLTGSYANSIEAFSALQHQHVDVLFLDIQMPSLNGIELTKLLQQNKTRKPPIIIFTTAYESFALKGFQLQALDYLLKPFTYEDFLRAAEKAEQQVGQNRDQSMAESDHLFFKVKYHLMRANLQDILYIEGQKDYVMIHLRGESKPIMSLTSLKLLEEKLPANRFMRIHRSHIIGLDHITSLNKTNLMLGSKVIPIGDQFRGVLQQFVDARTA